MIIYPAIDIKNGKCVMLLQGDAERETIYDNNPVDIALKWQDLGAEHLHIIDLDGAFSGESPNKNLIKEIIKSIEIPVQIGGGMRSFEIIEDYLKDEKVNRIILGTSAIENFNLLELSVSTFGNRIAVGLDAIDGFIAIEGWTKKTDVKALEFAKKLENMGVDTIIYTDISKDGMLEGPNLIETKKIIDKTNLNVIASGGITSLDDLKLIKKINASGAIIGQALYRGKIAIEDALVIGDGNIDEH